MRVHSHTSLQIRVLIGESYSTSAGLEVETHRHNECYALIRSPLKNSIQVPFELGEV